MRLNMLDNLRWYKVRSWALALALLAGCTDTAQQSTERPAETSFAARKQNKVLLAGRWNDPPVVLVCSDVSVSEARIKRALKYWQDLGYVFGPTVFMEPHSSCDTTWGTIMFRLPTQEELNNAINQQHLATTKRYSFVNNSTVIVAADIYFQNDSAINRDWIVEHEIGHALGWLHSRHPGHIMNAAWARSGKDSSGVTYNAYTTQTLEKRAK